MPKLRVLSGNDLIRIFAKFGFIVISQRGSHIKLKRTKNDGTKETLTIPNHKEIDRGTAKAIYQQASNYEPASILMEYFYTE